MDDSKYVKLTYWSAPGDTKPGFDEAVKQLEAGGQPLQKGFKFGLSWTNHWVKALINLPKEMRTAEQVICECPDVLASARIGGRIAKIDWSLANGSRVGPIVRSSSLRAGRGTAAWWVCAFIDLTAGITGGPNTMKDGKPGEQKDRRVEHIIPSSAVREGRYEVIIEVSCNSMFGLGPYRYQTPDVSGSVPARLTP